MRQATAKLLQRINHTRQQSFQAIAHLFAARAHPELKSLSSAQQQALWTILFMVAIADGEVDEDEYLYLKELSRGDQAILTLFTDLKNQPYPINDVESPLSILVEAKPEVQWRLLFWALELAQLNHAYQDPERALIATIQHTFNVSDEQLQVLLSFVNLLKLNVEQGLSGSTFTQQFTELAKQAKDLGVSLPHEIQKISNQNLSEYKRYYSDENLKSKLINYAAIAGKKTIETVLILFYTLQCPDLPPKYKAVIIGALGYWILPPDLLPDLMPVVGYSDDLSTLLMAMTVVASHINDDVRQKAQDKLKSWFGEELTIKKELPSHTNEQAESPSDLLENTP